MVVELNSVSCASAAITRKEPANPQHFFGLHYLGFRNRTALDELDSHRRRIFRASVLHSSHFSGKAVIKTTTINRKPRRGGIPSRSRPSSVRERTGTRALRRIPAPAHSRPAAVEQGV